MFFFEKLQGHEEKNSLKKRDFFFSRQEIHFSITLTRFLTINILVGIIEKKRFLNINMNSRFNVENQKKTPLLQTILEQLWSKMNFILPFDICKKFILIKKLFKRTVIS